MHLHKLVPYVFFSFQYFWWHGKEEEEEVIKKIANARNLGKRLGLSCKPYMYMIFLNKIKKKKKRKFERFGIITKVCSHEFKEPNFTGMKLRRCLASFFTFAGELKFTNNEKKFLEINLILYFSFYSHLLYFRNKKLFLRHLNQILYSSFKNTVQKNFMSVKKQKIFSFQSAQLRYFYCCENKNFNVNICKKEILEESFHGWIKRKSICIIISVLAQSKRKLIENVLQRTLKTTSECT